MNKCKAKDNYFYMRVVYVDGASIMHVSDREVEFIKDKEYEYIECADSPENENDLAYKIFYYKKKFRPFSKKPKYTKRFTYISEATMKKSFIKISEER